MDKLHFPSRSTLFQLLICFCQSPRSSECLTYAEEEGAAALAGTAVKLEAVVEAQRWEKLDFQPQSRSRRLAQAEIEIAQASVNIPDVQKSDSVQYAPDRKTYLVVEDKQSLPASFEVRILK